VSDSDDDFEGRLARKSAPTAFNSADPPRNFELSVNDRIRAMTIGAPAYATRKKSIEDREERFVAVLVALHDTLVAKRARAGQAPPHPDLVSRAMLDRAASFDLARLNELIDTHNRYYPIEANLSTDMRTGEYLVYGCAWLPTEPWTAARFVMQAEAVITARE
jgi:hypothetical protein